MQLNTYPGKYWVAEIGRTVQPEGKEETDGGWTDDGYFWALHPNPAETTGEEEQEAAEGPQAFFISWQEWQTCVCQGVACEDDGYKLMPDTPDKSFEAFAVQEDGTEEFQCDNATFFAYTEEQEGLSLYSVDAILMV